MLAAFGLGWVGLIVAVIVILGLLYFVFGRSRV
jgi:hypothetical protein